MRRELMLTIRNQLYIVSGPDQVGHSDVSVFMFLLLFPPSSLLSF